MPTIHALSYVHPKADIAPNVEIGPFCYVESDVVIGSGTRLDSHVVVKSGTAVGQNNFLANGTILGGDAQDRKYEGQPTQLVIGDDNVIREYVTIHRSNSEHEPTVVGNDCYIMAFAHLGHNSNVHDHVTIANNVALAGHVTVEEYATIGAMTGVHQFVRVGKVAMVGAMSGIGRDVPPFMLAEGRTQEIRDINAIGLRRYGVNAEARMALHKACKLLFKSQLGLTNAVETVRREVTLTPEVQYLLAFEERRFKGKNGRGDQR